jgi:endonuclease/exonuclease/phosphatase family metal-dependent hydrolase
MLMRALAEASFTLLTCNVAGLPELLSSGDPAANTPELGRRISNYDVVNVQEDFNYHATLYEYDTHVYRTATSGGAGIGSGLNTVSNYSFSNVTDLDRVKWTSCSTFDSADCLTPKGFTFLKLQLADGVTVDLYNLHADAGTTTADLAARKANLDQVAAYVEANSKDQAIIIMGDTNTRYTRDPVAEFVSSIGVTDAWVSYVRGGVAPTYGSDALVCDETNMTDTCEVVDKIFFRSNNYITLKLQEFANQNAKFLDSSGNMLSDHVPIASTFSYTLKDGLSLSNAYGGPHGDYYTDVASAASGQTVSSITIRAGNRVDAISLTVSSPTAYTFSHGGTGGTASTLTLTSGEYIKSMQVHWGTYSGHTRIFYLKFTTSTGRTVSGGSTTSDSTTVYAPTGYQISGFHGRSGDEVDNIGAIFTRITK